MKTTVITADRRRFRLDWKELWTYRDLILLFTRRNFTVRYKQTILGPLWALLYPLISSVFYLVVFGRIAGLGTDGVPQMLFYLSGTAVWSFFAACVTRNACLFRDNAAVFGKVYFPRLTVGAANVLSAGMDLAIQLALVLLLTLLCALRGTVQLTPLRWLLLPLLWVQLGLLGMGCGVLISGLTTRYRDLAIVVNFGVNLWMYATPVVYPLSTVRDSRLLLLLRLNPVTAPVELFRYCLFGVGQPNWGFYALSLLLTLGILLLGIAVFNRVEKNFIDTI